MANPAIVHVYYFVNENKVGKKDYQLIKGVLSVNWDKDFTEEITRIRIDKYIFVLNKQIRF